MIASYMTSNGGEEPYKSTDVGHYYAKLLQKDMMPTFWKTMLEDEAPLYDETLQAIKFAQEQEQEGEPPRLDEQEFDSFTNLEEGKDL